jgi:hypothetical protein
VKTGQRVYYRGHPGTVLKIYPGGDRERDESGQLYTMPAFACVRADAPLPDWWPYPGTDLISPETAELQRVES